MVVFVHCFLGFFIPHVAFYLVQGSDTVVKKKNRRAIIRAVQVLFHFENPGVFIFGCGFKWMSARAAMSAAADMIKFSEKEMWDDIHDMIDLPENARPTINWIEKQLSYFK